MLGNGEETNNDGSCNGFEYAESNEYVSFSPSSSNEKRRIFKSTTRRRTRAPSQWIDVNAKLARDSGIDGTDRNGRAIFQRKMGIGCGPCRFKCGEKINNADRARFFQEFWSLKDHSRQWDYLARCMTFKNVNKQNEESSKKKRISHSFMLETDKKIKVCRKMFLATFGKIKKLFYTNFRKFYYKYKYKYKKSQNEFLITNKVFSFI